MIKKNNKIKVVVAADMALREKLISKLAVASGLAVIPSDAAKLIRTDIHNYDLSTAYLVICSNYNFRGAVLTTQRLYEMSARGLCVILGAKSIPREYEFICEVYYPGDL